MTTSYTYESLYLGLHPIFDSFFENLSELSIYGETTLLAAKVKDYINRNFANKISIRDISDIFHIHPAHLSRLFKKKFGVSPMAYLTSVKIENAKELIRTTDMLLKDIAEKVGYTDPFYFSRMFKSITGSSPLEFRNKYN